MLRGRSGPAAGVRWTAVASRTKISPGFSVPFFVSFVSFVAVVAAA
jgi:hypothetical protein